jgi:hypothetical protein
MASPSEMKAAAEVAASVRPAASAPQARLPAEEAAVASGAKVQPRGAAEAELAPSVQQPEEAAVVSGVGVVLLPEVVAEALAAAAEPQQAGAGGGAAGRGGAAAGGGGGGGAGAFGAAAGGGGTLRRFLLGAGRGIPVLGLRHDNRRGLRMRCGGRELRCRQGSRGEQQDAKICHDVLGPRNRPDSNGMAFTGMSVGRLNG